MDRSCWDNTLDPTDRETLPTCLYSPIDKNMEDSIIAPQDSEGYEGCICWTSLDRSADGFHTNYSNLDDSRTENGFNMALANDSSCDPGIESWRFERASVLSLENMDSNTINNHSDELQSLLPAFNSSPLNQHCADTNDKNADTHGKIAEVPIDHYIQGLFELERVCSSCSDQSSSSGYGLDLGSGDGGIGTPVFGRCVASKRKSIDGTIGEHSAGENSLVSQENQSGYMYCSSVNHSISKSSIASSSSRYLHDASSLKEQLNPKPSIIGFSSCGNTSSIAGNLETFQRNCRLRLNPESHYFIPHANSSTTASKIASSAIRSQSEPSSLLRPLKNIPEESQLLIPPTHNSSSANLTTVNGPSSQRSASSSNSLNSKQRVINPCDVTNTMSMPRSDIINHHVFIGNNANNLIHGPSNQNPLNSTMTMTESVPTTSAGCSIGVNAFPGSTRPCHEVTSTQHQISLSEITFKSSPLVGSSYDCQSSTSYMQHSVQSTSREQGQSGGAIPPIRPLHTRHAYSLQRQHQGMPGIPLSIGSREGRQRMMSEIWNALGLMRRGVNRRFEDAIINDHAAFSVRMDLHDRHRDMRLDVDNMSYEELLALEDRIGYVSTGLAEDTILKNLRQHKHSLFNMDKVASAENEPCCICREEYCEGEDVGTLVCNHDFHTACIKKWLMIKNLCPICKITALETSMQQQNCL
ncbi:hypothetical protein HPP92_017323 [Vanilla planifolia]|uniref:RING-type E3 ubiquitin transferase n=1 Tax=Vanilla planifolia TaxID=51239 RepID=A0A835QFS7_VANPL|nr:hypothetical protein HPP92_017323 [Vanilla planifolia]